MDENSGGGGGGKKRKGNERSNETTDMGSTDLASLTVLVFNALPIYQIGHLEPNALHGSAPRTFSKYDETVSAHGAQQLQDTRATVFHLDYNRGDTFRIMYARSSAPATHVIWGYAPPQYLVRTLRLLNLF